MKLDWQKDNIITPIPENFYNLYQIVLGTHSSIVYLKYYWVSGEGGWMFDLEDSFQ